MAVDGEKVTETKARKRGFSKKKILLHEKVEVIIIILHMILFFFCVIKM